MDRKESSDGSNYSDPVEGCAEVCGGEDAEGEGEVGEVREHSQTRSIVRRLAK